MVDFARSQTLPAELRKVEHTELLPEPVGLERKQ